MQLYNGRAIGQTITMDRRYAAAMQAALAYRTGWPRLAEVPPELGNEHGAMTARSLLFIRLGQQHLDEAGRDRARAVRLKRFDPARGLLTR